MCEKRRFAALLVAILALTTAGLGQAGASRSPHAPRQTWVLQGRVYAGEVGDSSTPLSGVTVSLYGANDPHPAAGTFLRQTTTNGEGWYGLTVYDDDVGMYEIVYLLETDPEGYHSAGATSVGGMVQTPNWIEYPLPLEGRVLTGNKFWDAAEALPFDIPLDDVPVAQRRRGAQTLENVRGSDMAPG